MTGCLISSLRDIVSVVNHIVWMPVISYTVAMPKLWTETIEAHRREIREAIMDTTAAEVFDHGLASVTMSQIAEAAGIGRATLYKYFPDVESIMLAWHEGKVIGHLDYLAEVRDQAADTGEQLRAVLEAWALISQRFHGHHGAAMEKLLQRSGPPAHAQQQLTRLFRDLIADAAKTDQARDDVPLEELANYCLHAVGAAGSLPSKAAVQRLVEVILTGLRHSSDFRGRSRT
jgi:AcrR family transcriptional regulator